MTRLRGVLALAIVGLLAAVIVQSAAGDAFEESLRGNARTRAERTFVYAHTFGVHHRTYRRRFHLRGQPSFSVRATDGSTFTGFQATLDSADGTGDIVLLFDELHFVGWASDRMAADLVLGRRGNKILIRYAVYRPRNAICCPASRKAVTYGWNGAGVAVAGRPPTRAFNESLPRLHMSGS
jgi:hypothetical protein